MFLGRVVGQVWATREVDDLRGKRLLVVEALESLVLRGQPAPRGNVDHESDLALEVLERTVLTVDGGEREVVERSHRVSSE